MNPLYRPAIVSLVAWAVFGAFGPRAAAEQIQLQFVSTTGTGSVSFSLNGNPDSSAPGPYYWNANPPPHYGTNPIATFCIDLTTATANVTYQVVAPAAASTIGSQAKADAILALYGNYYNPVWNNPSTATSDMSFSSFQLALWELIHDFHDTGSNRMGTGIFQSTASAAATANSMLNTTLSNVAGGIANFYSKFPNFELVALVHPTAQDQLWLRPVPAPPAVLLAGIGLAALAGRSRWLRARTG